MLDQVRVLHDENDRLVDELRRGADRARPGSGPAHQHVPARRRRRARGRRRARSQQPAHGDPRVLGDPARGSRSEDPNRADVQTIRDAALRARTIVRALRDFARPREPQLAPTDLPELVTKMIDLVRFPLTRSGVIIRESHGELPLHRARPASDPAGDLQRTHECHAGDARGRRARGRNVDPRVTGNREDHRQRGGDGRKRSRPGICAVLLRARRRRVPRAWDCRSASGWSKATTEPSGSRAPKASGRPSRSACRSSPAQTARRATEPRSRSLPVLA